jgi:luciferase family oxidoreductase group 1
MPAIWLLGSSGYSAQLAGLLGLPFSFAHHFSAANTEPALALYRQNFRPSAFLEKPLAMVCVAVICADTDEQAQFLGGPARVSFAQLRSGQPRALITPQEAVDYEFSPVEQMFVRDRFAGQAVGSPETVRTELQRLLDRTKADELMLTTMVYDIRDRARSFELVAGKVAGGLTRPGS